MDRCPTSRAALRRAALLTLGLLGLVSPRLAPAAECTCASSVPLETALSVSTDVVEATLRSDGTSRSMSIASNGDGSSNRTTSQTWRWRMEVSRSLLGEYEAGDELPADYAVSCSELVRNGKTVATEARPEDQGQCTGSGLETQGSTGGPRRSAEQAEPEPVVVLLARTGGRAQLVRIATPEEAETLRNSFGTRSSEDPVLGEVPTVSRIVLRGTDPRLAPAAWLAGAWVHTGEGSVTEEHWTQPAGGTMLGLSRTIEGSGEGGETVFTERLSIGLDAQGRLFYEAHPSNASSPTRFLLEDHGPDFITFSNPEHDWPTHITYRRLPTGHVRAEVSGGDRSLQLVFTPATVTLPSAP